ncbi:MAG: LysR family transcriptional regulator [Endozoicomonas sp.]
MSTSHLDLNLLRIFCAVVEAESMTGAANLLDMNQSAVSSAMQKLRQNLGTELFIREKRGVKPTLAALTLYNNMSADLNRIDSSIAGMNAFDVLHSRRTFSITCPEFCSSFLLPLLPVADNPELKMVLHGQPYDSDSLIQQIMARELELFIDVTAPDHSSIEHATLTTDRSCVIASSTHPRLQGKEKISLEQFRSEPYIKLERTRDKKAGIQWLTDAPMHHSNIVSYTNSLFESMVLVSQTEMISTLPVSMASHYKDIIGFQVFDLPFSSQAITLYLLWHKAFDDDAGHRWLRNRIIQLYREKI